MALDASVAFVNTNGAGFPNTESVNASGPTATDGTEFIKAMVDNYMFGPQQAILDYAGLTPDGLAEAAGASQVLEAMQKSFGHPGEGALWWGISDPALSGIRILLLKGQGVLVADYPELVAATYVGDGNNGAAEGFYRADDVAGTIRNTGGIYFILPDIRGYGLRALDDTGLIDTDGGAGRLPGSSQDDQFESHNHGGGNHSHTIPVHNTSPDTTGTNISAMQNAINATSPGTNNSGTIISTQGGAETRMKNMGLNIGVRY